MTNWHVILVDDSKGETWDMVIRDAPERTDAVLAALDRIKNNNYDGPIFVAPEYVH